MNEKEIEILKNGGVGIIPTDTIYGIVASINFSESVKKIFELKGRDSNKSLIILISSIDDLKIFNVSISDIAKNFLEKYWPGKVSVILPFKNKNFSYLDSLGEGTLAFRFPNKEKLIQILKETGPLVAPSANLQGLPPAKNIPEAREYFGDKVDFYIDENDLVSEPSTLVKIDNEEIKVLREGAVKIN